MQLTVVRCSFTLQGVSELGFGRVFQTDKPPKGQMSDDDYDAKYWRERAHYDDEDRLHLPPLAVQKAVIAAAKRSGERIGGGARGQGWTGKFESGLSTGGAMCLYADGKQLTVDDLKMKKLFVPADGKAGSGSRVHRRFPYLPMGWLAQGEIDILDPIIPPEKLEQFLGDAGLYVGIGLWRPEKRGLWGRFVVAEFEVSK